MIEIKVLGAGCANCKRTKAIIAETIADYQFDASVVEVTDVEAIVAYGVMRTPAIVINEKVVSVGRIPGKATVAELIRTAQSKNPQ